MTPPRPTVTGRAAAARPLLFLLVVAAIAGACIGGERGDAAATPSASGSSQPSPSNAVASLTPQPSPSASPTVAPTVAPTESPAPTATPVEPTPTLAPADAVEGCAGNADNKGFYLQASEDLDWPVYCPVLPGRWVVARGSYSGRGVGLLEISYNGPSGATLVLQEGAFCETSDGCVPAGTDAGEAAFGDQSGTLVTLDDGGYAIVVGRADTPSWLAVATGVDEATFRSFAEAFVRLD